jgi:hypothetical protein
VVDAMSHGSSTDLWCERGGCENEAWYRIEAQWTLFDWLEVHVCGPHLAQTMTELAERLVDGERPLALESYTLPMVSE